MANFNNSLKFKNRKMKHLIKSIAVLCSIILITGMALVNPPKKTTITFKVFGVCGDCKERIEEALDRKGIYKSLYNFKTQQVTITYKTGMFKEEQFHNMVAMVGHDTELVKADNVVYSNLPECCKYRDGAKCTDEEKE